MIPSILAALSILDLSAALPQYGEDPGAAGNAANLKGLGNGLNFNFTPSDTPRPFAIEVDPDFIAATQLKAELYRPSRDIAQPDWTDGPPGYNISNVQQYWVQNYSWFSVQDTINAKYKQYTTTVSGGPNFTEPVYLHFAHHPSNASDAIPLLLLHGWPSSFLEWDLVIDDLVSPPNSSLPSFNVVAPDLPGYGFSPAATAPGLGSREMGQAFNNLMHQLGYSKYAIYVTDISSPTGRWMLYDSADSIVSMLNDFYIIAPNADDLARFDANQTTPEETTFIERWQRYTTLDYGYFQIQANRPLQLAEALTDSPVGFLAWQWQIRHVVSGNYSYTPEELITDTLALFIQGVFGNVRDYKEATRGNVIISDTDIPPSDIPIGATHWHSGDDIDLDDPWQYGVRPLSPLWLVIQLIGMI